jgi:hypothetical protein
MKTPQQAAGKWDSSTQQGTQTWLTNLQQTQKPIVSAAIQQRNVMQANFQASTAAGGIWEQRLSAVGDAGIKAAAAAKSGNYATGVSQAQPKFLAAITKVMAYEAAGLPAIYSMPSGSTEAGVARASAWIRYMAAGKGQLGA